MFRVSEPSQNWDVGTDYGNILNVNELCLAAMTTSVQNMYR
jgi:hypothetical protein